MVRCKYFTTNPSLLLYSQVKPLTQLLEIQIEPRLAALKQEVESWISDNSYSTIKLVNFDAEQLQLQFTIGYAVTPFQVFINHENLKPLVQISPIHHLIIFSLSRPKVLFSKITSLQST
jgi:hypothetical protein